MFNNRNKQEAQMRAAEERQMNFGREQSAVNSVANPSDDQLFLYHQEQKQDLLRWQQELGDDLEQLKHDLRSETRTNEGWERKEIRVRQGNEIIEVEMPPLMNELGIQMVETEIRPLISRNLINSNLTEERILSILKDTSNTLVNNLADNYDIYEVDFINFDHIMRLVKNVFIPTPFRALAGWNKRMDNTMSKRIEAFTEQQQAPAKKGFMGIGGR